MSELPKPDFEEALLAVLDTQAKALADIHADLVAITYNLTCLKEAFASSAEGAADGP